MPCIEGMQRAIQSRLQSTDINRSVHFAFSDPAVSNVLPRARSARQCRLSLNTENASLRETTNIVRRHFGGVSVTEQKRTDFIPDTYLIQYCRIFDGCNVMAAECWVPMMERISSVSVSKVTERGSTFRGPIVK